MVEAVKTQLRGYDSYRVSLGDEMRGERASLGKSLLDVQRDLRIKAAHIDAIENSNPAGIPFTGFVSGYVRAYARYLGMDEDAVLRRFCEEAGFEAGAARISGPHAPATPRTMRRDDLDAVIAGSRLAAASQAASVSASLGSTLRGASSLGVMIALVAGLGYGGWSVLESVQRVTFAPLPDGPEALAALPDFDSMTRIARASVGPAPRIDAAALAAVYAAQEVEPPRVDLRDGPISALDPAASGVYAAAAASADAVAAPDPAFLAALSRKAAPIAVAAAVEPAAPAAPAPAGVALVVDAEAWVRVRNATGAVVHEALMRPGQRWRAPGDAAGFTLRAGNAGGVFVEVDGALYGPIGKPGGVVSNVLLDAEAVRRVFPTRDAAAAPRTESPEIALSAELVRR